MSLHSQAVAESLASLSEKVHSATLIDAAQSCGKIAAQDLVMTSMGNVHRAVITPYYPAFQLEHSLFDRLAWAGIFRRPFVEAALHVRADKAGSLRAANVVLRLCENPELGNTTVLETGCSFPLDDGRKYGTMERVVDDICAIGRHLGQPLPGRTGWVDVAGVQGSNGKWAISRVEHVSEPYEADAIPGYIHDVISDKLNFVDNPAF